MHHEAAAQFEQTHGSRKRVMQWCAWAGSAAFAAYLFLNDFMILEHRRSGKTSYWGHDFINVWTGGHLVRDGRARLLNDYHAYFAYQQSLFGNIDTHNYSYPPVSYPLAAAFSCLPYWVALAAWISCTGALFIYAAKRWWPARSGPVWLAALTPAALMNVWDGQYGYVIGALFLFGWKWLDKHPKRAGIAFGLMLLKPHLAALIPMTLLLRKDWTALGAAAATVAFLIGGTTLMFGWQSWADFLFRTGSLQASMIDAKGNFFGFMSTSIATAAMQFGAGWNVALVIQGLAAIASATMICIAVARRTATRKLAFLVATCTFLMLPYAFNYDLTVVAIGAAALIATDDLTDVEYAAAVCGFVCPSIGMLVAVIGFPAMPLALIALAAAQFYRWVVVETAADLGANPTHETMPLASEL